MADQNNNPAPEAANNNMDKAKKAGGIMLAILNFMMKWLILKPLKVGRNQSEKLMKELMSLKGVLLKRVLGVYLLMLAIFNPLFLLFNGSWAHYTSMSAYAWEVILAGKTPLWGILFFGAVALGAFVSLSSFFKSAVSAFGKFTSLMILGIPSLLCASIYFAFPALQTLSELALIWVVMFIMAFYMGAGLSAGKIKLIIEGRRQSDSTIVDDHTEEENGEQCEDH